MDYEAIVLSAAGKMNLVGPQNALLPLDSLAIVELTLAIEKATKLKIPTAELRLEVFESVASIVAMLRGVAVGKPGA
jgi:hypothetical protein